MQGGRWLRSRQGFDRFLYAFAPVFLLRIQSGMDAWGLFWGAGAFLSCLLAARFWSSSMRVAQVLGSAAVVGLSYLLMAPLGAEPRLALVYAILAIFLLSLIFRGQPREGINVSQAHLRYARRGYASLGLMGCSVACFVFAQPLSMVLGFSSLAVSALLYVRDREEDLPRVVAVLSALVLGAIVCLFVPGQANLYFMVFSFIWVLLNVFSRKEARKHWGILVDFFSHPSRILFGTFFVLCFLGTVLLFLPVSAQGSIDFIDAAFTAVSSVCVTGLVVLDTAHDFSLLGQVFILCLIQLGGLGIMTIAAVALHSMGKRLSLRQEHALSEMANTDQHHLGQSLAGIVKFTFITEGIGACALILGFMLSGKGVLDSIWEGVFTSISAFCNAGFSLQSSNLIAYAHEPFILLTVSVLIILGGLAPATCVLIPAWMRFRRVPIAASIALKTSLFLLMFGFFFTLALEWNGLLDEFSGLHKVSNAWFLSVSLRTAGFNTFELTNASSPLFLIMIFLMFVGGSPGGTAGGIKTSVLAVLLMAFWAHVNNKSDVIIRNRKVRHHTIFRAITIVMAGGVMLFVLVLLLELTQTIPARLLVFEAASALGTVGLSMGATTQLDDIGKILIILGMFGGRIGPLSLFMLLSNDSPKASKQYPDIQIPLT